VLFDRAHAGGARSLGHEKSGLLVGASADIVSLDTRAAPFVPTKPDQWLDHWIFAARRPMVDCVWRAGEKLVQGGRHIRAERIERRYREVLARLAQRL
jgi:cytosine/adenosine deaminase-related metal-dependent hydrolase